MGAEDFFSTCKRGRWTRFGDAGWSRRRAPHRWTVRNCRSSRFLIAVGLESQLESVSEVPGNPSDSLQTDCYYTFRRWFALLRGPRDAAESGKDVRCTPPRSAEEVQAPAMLVVWLLCESQAGQRYTRLALCLEPVQASVALVRPSHQVAQSHQRAKYLPACLSTFPKYLQCWPQFWTSPEAQTRWRKSSERIWVGQQRKRSTPKLSTAADQEGEGSRDWAATDRCTAFHTPITGIPELSLRRTGREVREDLTTLPEESGSGERPAEECLLHHCGRFGSLRWVSVMVTGDLDEGRIGGSERHHAICQIYGMLESAAKASCWDCPTPTPNQTSLQVRQQGLESKGAKAKEGGSNLDRVVIFMMLAQLVITTGHGSSRGIKVGDPCLFFCTDVLFREKQSSRNLSARRSPQLVLLAPRGGVGSRCPPARAIVRAVTATKHEPGLSPSYRVVSYGSALEVWALLMRLSGCQGARSEGFAVVATDKPPPSRPQKISSPLVSASPVVLQLHRCSIGFPHAWRTISCKLEDADALGDDSSFFAVTQQQCRACGRRMLRCKLACVLPPSSFDPRLASGAFAVSKDEDRDRFIGYRRPLNGRERSIGRAHLPYCPRLRRMILEKSETVQIANRDTKDFFFLYEVLPSRVTKRVIGLRIPRSWLGHLDDENRSGVDTDEIEGWLSQDLLKTCTSVEPVSESDYCQIGMTAIVMGDVNAALECARRRQLLGARALHERSLLISGLSFTRTKTIRDVYIDDPVILSVFAMFKRAP